MKAFLADFLPKVAWPAVAGNVAWSFATLAVDQGLDLRSSSRLAVLLVFAVYLAAEWYRGEKVGQAGTLTSHCFDLGLVVCVVWFAIATQMNKGQPGVALLIILFGVGVGHILGVWPPTGRDKGNLPHGLVSSSGACLLLASWLICGYWNWWLALVVLVIVLAVWAIVRYNKTA